MNTLKEKSKRENWGEPMSLLLTRLRDETREFHDAVERQLGLFDRHWSPAKYRGLLQRLLGYYEPLELRLESAVNWSELGFDWPRRRKTSLLQRDLLSTGDSLTLLSELPRCSDLPEVGGLPQALGCLYVLEGATLGGRVICRHLAGLPAMMGNAWFSFFSSYGDQIGSMWQEFREFLTVSAGGSDESIIEAACNTFLTMGIWLEGWAPISILSGTNETYPGK